MLTPTHTTLMRYERSNTKWLILILVGLGLIVFGVMVEAAKILIWLGVILAVVSVIMWIVRSVASAGRG